MAARLALGARCHSPSHRARRIGPRHQPSAACLQAVTAPSPALRSFAMTASSGSDPSGALASAPLWLVRRLGCPRFDCYRLGWDRFGWCWFGWCWLGWCWLGCGCLLGAGVLGQHGFRDAASGRDRNAVLPGPCPDGRGVPNLWPSRTVLATSGARVHRACPACSVDRSISYVRPSTAKRTFSAAWEPSMSSMSLTVVVRANRCLRVAFVVLLQCARAARVQSGR